MYFVKRGEVYHDVAGASFRDLLEGRLAALPGERATISDWANHLSTIFPEVRLKRYLEMRGADVGPPERILALTAFCFGLFYDKDALAAAGALVRGWTAGDLQRLRDDVPRLGLEARIGGRPLAEAAREAVAIARGGLERRARRDAAGRDETFYLAPLERIAAEGRTPAQDWIDRFKGPWQGSVDPIFREAVI
jgi:glutamate--cysteine ligase